MQCCWPYHGADEVVGRWPALPPAARQRCVWRAGRGSRPLIVAIVVASAVSAEAQLALRPVVSGLSKPVGFVQDPARATVQYIVEQGGVVRVLVAGALQPTPFLDLRGSDLSTGGEWGLLGLAFPPDYASSKRFYVNLTNRDGHTVIARFVHRANDPFAAEPGSRFDLRWPDGRRFIEQPFVNHNGGQLIFGPDGHLYIGLGDGGSADDPFHLAQDPQSLLGKMLRIDVGVSDDDPAGYRVPPDNPFASGRGPGNTLPEIWAFGLRNPWRFAEDRLALGGTGAFVIADVGQGAREEINYEPRGKGGRNYGWRNFEGTRANVMSLPPAYLPLQPPLFDYGHDEGRSVTGGVVYRGTKLGPEHRGRYFFADFISRRVWSLGLVVDPVTGEAAISDRREHTAELGGWAALGNITSVDADADGEMYLVDWTGGRVLAIESAETDADGDTLPDAWEQELGLDPASAMGADGADGDPDGDGRTNAQEYVGGTHPRGLRRYYLAEGAQTAYFDATCAMANAGSGPAHLLVTFNRFDGRRIGRRLVVPPRGHARLRGADIPELAGAAFGLTIESDTDVSVDRTMKWDGMAGPYGGHAETATDTLSATWYFAEGATHSAFNLFYLLTNPNPVSAEVTIRYLRPPPLMPIAKVYHVPPESRYTVWVDFEDPQLAATDVAAVIDTAPDTPIVVERAMYWDTGGRQFEAGHVALGVRGTATRWFLAEGATGTFFDMFVLVANPGAAPADLAARFLLSTGEVITYPFSVPAQTRVTLWVDTLDPRLASADVSVVVESLNDVPVVVERAMWWPGPTAATWAEAHASVGVSEPGPRWLVAGGESGGRDDTATWILVANTGPDPVTVDVTVLFEDRTPVSRELVLAGTSRYGFDVASLVPEAAGRSYGVLVEARDAGAPLVVERATYWNADGRFWAGGVNAVGLRLP